jgi:hypothetical protein
MRRNRLTQKVTLRSVQQNCLPAGHALALDLRLYRLVQRSITPHAREWLGNGIDLREM